MGLTQITTGGVDDNINIDSNTLKVDGTNNRVGIGTASPGKDLEVYNTTGPTISLNDGGQYKSYFTLLGNDLEVRGSSGNVEFYTGSADGASSTERMRIDSSGRVAIGHQSPSDPLHVKGASGIQFSVDTPSGGQYTQMSFRNDGTQKAALWWNNTSSSFENYVASGAFKWNISTEKMRLDSSGRLLIGGTNTYHANADNLVVQGTGQVGVTIASTSTGKSNLFFADDTSNPGTYACYFEYDHNTDDLKIGQGNSERMRIDSSGRVGIGTSSATQRLTVGAGSGPEAILVRTGSGNTGELRFSDTGDDNYQGAFVYNHVSNAMQFLANSAERMRIDSSGNVGIGTTSPTQKLDVRGSVYVGTSIGINTTSPNGLLTVEANSGRLLTFRNSTTGTGSSDGSYIALNGSDLQISNAESANTIFYTGDTERMRIDSSGRLFVGTTSELISGAEKKLQMLHANAGAEIVLGRNDSSVGSGNSLGAVKFVGNDGGTYHQCAQIEAIADGSHSNSAKPTRLQFNVTSGSAVTPSERLRIESEGRAMFFAEQAVTYISSAAGAGTSHALITGVHSNSTVSLRVWTNGNIQNTNNSYGSLSDSKLKENIVDANPQWDDIKDIRVRNYNFIEGETHTQLGVVAQEVETVSPGLVYETPDVDDDGNDLGTVTKSVNYSVLYMKAVKALQEAMDRIETLETKVAALEAAE